MAYGETVRNDGCRACELKADYTWPSGRPGGCRAGTARRASRAVPLRASCLAISPSTGLWAVFRAGPGQPRAHDELRVARERGKGRKRERAAGDRGVGVELVAGSGVGAELGASALVRAAAEAGLLEAMAALDVGSHEKRRGWRGFGDPRGSRSSRRRRRRANTRLHGYCGASSQREGEGEEARAAGPRTAQ